MNRLSEAWTVTARRTAPSFNVGELRRRLSTSVSRPLYRFQNTDRGRPWFFQIIAVWTAVAAIGIAISYFASSTAKALQRIKVQEKEVDTNRGQYADIYLSDGTRVRLAPESRLRFTSPLSDTARELWLDGRALFEVSHEPTRPFRVHTTLGVVEDLGTRFDIKQYAGDTVLTVVVAEGMVALQGANSRHAPTSKQHSVSVGDKATLTARGLLKVEQGVDVARETAWSSGSLSFDAVPLRDAVRELRRYYDLEFVIPDSTTAARRLTASFERGPPTEVVRVIAVALELPAQIRGKTVTFFPRERL